MQNKNGKSSVDSARKRAQLLGEIRSFFLERGVLEVETPTLSGGVSVDRHLDVFSTRVRPAGSSSPRTFYLQTSPEFHMKRLLCDGFPDIFQICKSFRNDERGALHNPEFSILEWYRRGFSLQDLTRETADLVQRIAGPREVRYIHYRQLFIDTVGLDPLEADLASLHAFCESTPPAPPRCDTRTDLLQFIMAIHIEPSLPGGTLIFVTHYPADQAILAVLDREDPRTARRFELYLAGMELANGWEECGDPTENRRRLDEENRHRVRSGKSALPLDERFLRALEGGLPPCSGAALGVDRLIMAALGAKRIEEVVLFPWEES